MARTIDLEERKQFRVLLNPVRQDIIHLLRRAGRPMTANTVAEKMLLSPSAAQSHLNKLEELGVVELGVYTAPDGRQATYYRLADVEIRLCLGRKDGFQGEREALARPTGGRHLPGRAARPPASAASRNSRRISSSCSARSISNRRSGRSCWD